MSRPSIGGLLADGWSSRNERRTAAFFMLSVAGNRSFREWMVSATSIFVVSSILIVTEFTEVSSWRSSWRGGRSAEVVSAERRAELVSCPPAGTVRVVAGKVVDGATVGSRSA
jgi:hypothetical protein